MIEDPPSSPPVIDVVVDPAWHAVPLDLDALAAAASVAVLRGLAVRSDGVELGVTFADDETVRTLNREWRGRDSATDVIAFPSEAPSEAPARSGAPRLLGDVVLAFETCRRDAEELDRPLADHLRHLIVHGVLHLFHFDHQTPDEAVRMERLEVAVLADLGVADPYAGRPPLEEGLR